MILLVAPGPPLGEVLRTESLRTKSSSSSWKGGGPTNKNIVQTDDDIISSSWTPPWGSFENRKFEYKKFENKKFEQLLEGRGGY